MKRRDFAIAGTSLTGALLLGCSEGTDGEMMGTGGASTGGAGTGGVGTGGAGTGGVATGGAATGGAATGGAATGGAATGGDASTGGAATGGEASTGGAGSGGDASTGGAGSGGDTSSGGEGSGGETNTGGGGGGEMCASLMVDISDPHMHLMDVTPQEVEAAMDKTYDIQGDNQFHGHTVVVTAAHFAMLAGGGMVEIESSSDGGHSHTVTIVCTV